MVVNNITYEPLFDKDRVTIEFDRKERQNVIQALSGVNGANFPKDFDFILKVHRKKRSLDANGYMWILADKLADVLRTTKEKVYQEAVRQVGVFTDVAVQDKAVDDLIAAWNSNGIGWISERFDSKLDGCKKVRLYIGSSQYDTKEMSRLIDYIVDEAKEQGIETMTPDEIAELKSKWRN